ncbi:hypothetical protein PV10_01444 [Exophiala mesophila]|uniref:Uncharacterized protein n=1 Tax=Exophiala mesophila TaxID=212818 RepID=A0A0D2AFP8_EXOME|nr:uncharacterized protein PV10_01444 [Exophiala mesophila]KIV97733.1 hypothetical protein PV10_01444 [Exophiala mesophila]
MASQTSSLSLSICRTCLRRTAGMRLGFAPAAGRPAFSTSSRVTAGASSNNKNNNSQGKPIVLERPDQFRPPSHPSRLGRRRPTPGPAAYNQGATREEKEKQKTRSYPHTFPNQGTFMHWFLTNRAIHLWITMGTLVILASITLTQTFLKTSPYGHLIPPISQFLFHPINYITESLSIIRLHIDYTTEKTNASRQQKILDAQKRRLYRRAHGMEDLNAEEEEGIDVRGIAPWDDGLTNKERARGGREERVTGLDVLNKGGKVGDDVEAFAEKMKQKRDLEHQAQSVEKVGEGEGDGQGEVPPAPQQQRKRKLYFGLW